MWELRYDEIVQVDIIESIQELIEKILETFPKKLYVLDQWRN